MKLIELNNTIVALDRIKAISLNSFNSIGATNQIRIALNTKNEYVYNPDLEKHELVQSEESVLMDFPDFQTAKEYLLEMMGVWEDALGGMNF